MNNNVRTQYLNRVELAGFVGSARRTEVQGRTLVSFTVATNFARVIRGERIVETTWWNVSAWEGKGVPQDVVNGIAKGAKIHLIGRLRNNSYTGADGVVRTAGEVLASTVELLDRESLMAYQTS